MLARVSNLIDYDPVTGIFSWKTNRRGHARAGSRAGTLGLNGYRRIGIDGREYLEHRLAWLIIHGDWPTAEIDHINGDPADNRLCNLREATRSQNCQNFKPRRSNSSGHTGVSYAKALGAWHAQIMRDGRQIHLGYFETTEAAAEAYRSAKLETHDFNPLERTSPCLRA